MAFSIDPSGHHFKHCAFKRFPFQLTSGHCTPSPGYTNEIHIFTKVGGSDGGEKGRGGGGIVSSSGGLCMVEVGRVMSWFEYRARAEQEGGRLPTTKELASAGVDVGYDQWTPITFSDGDHETGRRDGVKGSRENAWANIGPRKYQTEFPQWGLDASTHPWKHLTYFYVAGLPASGGDGGGGDGKTTEASGDVVHTRP